MHVFYIYMSKDMLFIVKKERNIFLTTILQTTNIKLKCKMILKRSFSFLMKILNNFKTQFMLVVITCV